MLLNLKTFLRLFFVTLIFNYIFGQIPVRLNRPVGCNLQDHPTCVMEYRLDLPPSINVDSTLSNPNSREYQQLMFFSKG